MTEKSIDTDRIEALLPQTQCTLCNYPGCRPYAEAIANGTDTINHCLPGGVETLQALGTLLKQDPTPYRKGMEEQQKPAMRALIQESLCIGCTKCLQACPVDAIIGIGKKMHTVIVSECTGCGLCVPPCPMDCIEMEVIPTPKPPAQTIKAPLYKKRFEARNDRLAKKEKARYSKHQQAKQTLYSSEHDTKRALQAAIARANAKKHDT